MSPTVVEQNPAPLKPIRPFNRKERRAIRAIQRRKKAK